MEIWAPATSAPTKGRAPARPFEATRPIQGPPIPLLQITGNMEEADPRVSPGMLHVLVALNTEGLPAAAAKRPGGFGALGPPGGCTYPSVVVVVPHGLGGGLQPP
jgi:hypothetical protein